MMSEPILYDLLVFAAGIGCAAGALALIARYLDHRHHRGAMSASAAVAMEERLVRLEAALDATMDEVRHLKTTQRFTVSLLENRQRTLGRPAADPPRGVTPH
jgi:alkylation response protein AidB-like acyl-CoA dehydrogenase